MNGYIHVSFDPVERFVPRIPRNRMFNEDETTERISVGTQLLPCLHAVPYGIDTLYRAYTELKDAPFLHPVLHVYTLWTEEIAYRPTVKEVPDVEKSGERWLLKEPEYVTREDLLVTNMEYKMLPHEPFTDDKYIVPSLIYERAAAEVDNVTMLVRRWFPNNPNTGFIAEYLRKKGCDTSEVASWGYGFEVVMKMLDRDGLLHIGLAGMQKGA